VSPQHASATTDPGESGRRRGLEQEIRFCAVGDARVAYATVGSGPALLLPALWISHLELEWEFDEFRAFVGALARTRTVIRYDRLGTGLSDRPDPAPDAEMRTLEAVAGALGVDELSLLGISRGGCTAATFAARYPARVRSIVLVGAYAEGARIAPARLREAMVSTVRAHWGAGSRLLADVWLPGADAQTRERFTRLQRAAASAEVAAAMLEAVYEEDARDVLPHVDAPALVLHRRHDRAIPFAQGREVAALLPRARLVALDGEMHPPWLGDSAAVLRPVRDFLDANHPAGDRSDAHREGPLTEREREVLRLAAEGLSDGEIAERLIVSPHTVHRHMANIRTKLNQSSRAAAAAYAVRRGLI
jgi:pimeloyl-ACP methyl ester carboxylesterase/DNA-binding CsgD family transcriptional regulator